MPKTSNLSINVPGVASTDARSGLASPRTPHTPHTPLSPLSADQNKAHFGDGYDSHIHSPVNALPPPPSPKSPRHRTPKLFGNKLASKSTSKLTKSDSSPQQSAAGSKSPANASAGTFYLNSSNSAVNKSSPDVSHPYSGQSSPDAVEFGPDPSNGGDRSDGAGSKERGFQSKKAQHKFGNFLNRKASLRGDEPLPPATTPISREKPKPAPIKAVTQPIDVPVRTAPVEKERGFRSAMNSALRNRSLDRAEDDRPLPPSQQGYKPSSLGANGVPANAHGSLVSNIRSGSTRAAEGISKAKKGLFGNFKLNRSGSSHEREQIRNEPYELKVLILPLEEQARITRIAKRLHYCKDKTEFWLPAFPYRCIDYLSDKGTYSEGLYRVPGSELEIKHYMARFDREHDIDLFEQRDLHDVNVVATMLKRWLSNLPPVFPPELQTEIIKKCSETTPAAAGNSTPEFMKQKLSELPPWNYYLLFAITGHISFLHNHRDQNKMTYENLFRCFATRALQVEPYIFWWLVWDWRNCWLGCAREEEFKIKEYAVLDREAEAAAATQQASVGNGQPGSDRKTMQKDRKASKHSVSAISKQSVSHAPTIKQVKSSGDTRPQTAHPQARSRSREREKTEKEKERERNLSSSDSSKPSITGQSSVGRSASPSTGGIEEEEASASTLPPPHGGKNQDMGLPILSPLKPLSPIGNL